MESFLGNMKSKKLLLLLAILTTGIFLIYAEYGPYVNQLRMKPDTGEGSCYNHAV